MEPNQSAPASILPLAHVGKGIRFSGYCPKNSKAKEGLKEVMLWAFSKNDGSECIMSIPVMVRLLKEMCGIDACPRTVLYVLKRLVLEGFITRQSRWLKVAPGVIKHYRSKTRAKGRLLVEQLQRGFRGLRLAAMTWWPGRGDEVQKIASGYHTFLKGVLPNPLK